MEVHRLAEHLHIYDADEFVAVHPVLEGHGQRCAAAEHRHWPPPGNCPPGRHQLPAPAPWARRSPTLRCKERRDEPPALGASSALDTIEALVVRLKFALALEVLRDWVRQLDAGEPSALDLLAQLLGEEQAARKTRRLRAASMTVRFTQIEILQSFDFSFQPSLNKRSCLRTGTNALHRTRRSCPSLGSPDTGNSLGHRSGP